MTTPATAANGDDLTIKQTYTILGRTFSTHAEAVSAQRRLVLADSLLMALGGPTAVEHGCDPVMLLTAMRDHPEVFLQVLLSLHPSEEVEA
jgi:hypothetical protein